MTEFMGEYELTQYKEIEALDNNKPIHKVYLVKDMRDNSLWVKKEIEKAAFDIYHKIKNIKNKNIVHIRDVLQSNGKYYVIEEYLDGMTIGEILMAKGSFTLSQTRDIMCYICDGLKCVHNIGIIHRDITLSNIIVTTNGDVKLIDFGISRIKKEESSIDTTIIGTKGYAAPEQFGFSQTNITADIYSCGVVMNIMLTGKFPFEEKYKGDLDYIIEKCIQMDSKSRYQSISELKTTLLKKSRLKKYTVFFDNLPGIRECNAAEKTISSVVYLLFTFFLAFSVGGFILGSDKEAKGFAILCVSLIIPLILAYNYMGYEEKLKIIKNLNIKARRFFGFSLAFIFFLGILLIYYCT